MFNKKSKMMLQATRNKLQLINWLIDEIKPEDRHGDIYECHVAQRVILTELLRELEAIEAGKAIVKGSI